MIEQNNIIHPYAFKLKTMYFKYCIYGFKNYKRRYGR